MPALESPGEEDKKQKKRPRSLATRMKRLFGMSPSASPVRSPDKLEADEASPSDKEGDVTVLCAAELLHDETRGAAASEAPSVRRSTADEYAEQRAELGLLGMHTYFIQEVFLRVSMQGTSSLMLHKTTRMICSVFLSSCQLWRRH